MFVTDVEKEIKDYWKLIDVVLVFFFSQNSDINLIIIDKIKILRI